LDDLAMVFANQWALSVDATFPSGRRGLHKHKQGAGQ
jgi:hypothetical protein